MTDESTDAPTAVEPAAPEPAAPEPIPFWNRPHVERYLAPLVTPIIVVVGLVVYVLNLSRVFLSAHGHIAVVVGSIVTVAILLGATLLSNASRLQSTSIALMTAAFVFAVFSGGWLVLGHSAEKKVGGTALTAVGPSQGAINITAGPTGGLTFGPVSLTVPTGIYKISLRDGANAQHTLDFDNPATLFTELIVNSQGETKAGRIFFGEPGDYTFFCAVPGHQSAGMKGVVHVTGTPKTLAQAEAAGK